jgi:tRNA threonylcarbamoyladenosine biosynthesis protein TsaB
LTIDTASDYAGIALTEQGRLVRERIWYCPRRHSSELSPAIAEIMSAEAVAFSEISLVVACTGPGGYTGLRVGVTTAKTLAHVLGVKAAGVPRLQADAAHWLVKNDTVCAVHRAGRRDLAVAIYAGSASLPVEEVRPQLVPLDGLDRFVPAACLVTGEVPDESAATLRAAGHEVITGLAGQRRPSIVARLGVAAHTAGQSADPQQLLPIYLRPPVQAPPPAGAEVTIPEREKD